MHGCYYIQPLAHHNKIYTVATDFWHQALVHCSIRFSSDSTDIYAHSSILPKHTSEFLCPVCDKSNSKHCVSLPVSSPQSNHPFDLIHAALLVPLSVESLWRHKYMLTFVEDKTYYSDVNFVHKKSDAPRLIQGSCEEVITQMQRCTRSFRTD